MKEEGRGERGDGVPKKKRDTTRTGAVGGNLGQKKEKKFSTKGKKSERNGTEDIGKKGFEKGGASRKLRPGHLCALVSEQKEGGGSRKEGAGKGAPDIGRRKEIREGGGKKLSAPRAKFKKGLRGKKKRA